jgi:hypothetical protein
MVAPDNINGANSSSAYVVTGSATLSGIAAEVAAGDTFKNAFKNALAEEYHVPLNECIAIANARRGLAALTFTYNISANTEVDANALVSTRINTTSLVAVTQTTYKEISGANEAVLSMRITSVTVAAMSDAPADSPTAPAASLVRCSWPRMNSPTDESMGELNVTTVGRKRNEGNHASLICLSDGEDGEDGEAGGDGEGLLLLLLLDQLQKEGCAQDCESRLFIADLMTEHSLLLHLVWCFCTALFVALCFIASVPPPSSVLGGVLFWAWAALGPLQMVFSAGSLVDIGLATVRVMRRADHCTSSSSSCAFVGVLLTSLGLRPVVLCNATAFALGALLTVQAWRVRRALRVEEDVPPFFVKAASFPSVLAISIHAPGLLSIMLVLLSFVWVFALVFLPVALLQTGLVLGALLLLQRAKQSWHRRAGSAGVSNAILAFPCSARSENSGIFGPLLSVGPVLFCCGSATIFGMLLAVSVCAGRAVDDNIQLVRNIYAFSVSLPFADLDSLLGSLLVRPRAAVEASWAMPDMYMSSGPVQLMDRARGYLLLSMACAWLRLCVTLICALRPSRNLSVCLLEGGGEWASKGGVSCVQRLAKTLQNPASSKRLQLSAGR